MRKYDLTVLVRGDMDQKEKDAFIAVVEKIVKALEGKMGKMTEMGKKQLAYKIRKMSEAIFLNWSLELPGAGVVQLDRKLTIDKDVLRHLLVVAEPTVTARERKTSRAKSK
jgi:small subunit ribosomal protein S6